jgi:hypothetical protein
MRGDYDWSHQAMDHRPCKYAKSVRQTDPTPSLTAWREIIFVSPTP